MAGLKTSRRETFVVQPYGWRGRNLTPRQPLRLDSEAQAVRRGEEMRATCAGIVVLHMEVADDVDYCGEPRVVATFGEVPAD